MAHSLAQVYLHSVFSTKYRQNLIIPEIEISLFAYMGGIIKDIGGMPIQINGMPDHIHILSTLPRTITIAKYIEEIKRGSSKWIKTQGSEFINFAWQVGYGAFSYGRSQLSQVIEYICRQEEHHRKRTFREEYEELLNRFDVGYNSEYLFEWIEDI